MSTVIFEAEKAAFKFDLQDVTASLQEDDSLGHHKDAVELAMFLELSTEQMIDIPQDKQFFKFVALDLVAKGKGSVLCFRCQESYPATELQCHPIGLRESPVRVKIKGKGGVVRRRTDRPGTMGGKGYQCPEGHELITIVTWVT